MSDVHVLSGSYVLDALDEEEHARFERHLRTCPECVVEVAEFREVTALLGGGVALAPAGRFRGRVMAGMAVSRQLPVAGRVRLRRHSWARMVALVRIAMPVAIAVVVAGAAALLGTAWAGDRATGAAADRATSRAGASATVADSASADRMTEIARVLTNSGRTEVGTAVAGGSMRLLTDGASAVLVATGVSAAPEGKTYQIWLFDDEGVRPVEMLSLRNGFGQSLVQGVRTGATIAVSVEPDAGSRRPTTRPFVTLRIT